jgi:hypothetical protein
MDFPHSDRLAIGSRLVVIPAETPIDISKMTRAILFIEAKWSGTSRMAFLPLAKVLAAEPSLGDLVLYIADTDNPNAAKFFSEIGDFPAGNGETYWIVNGKIVRKTRCYYPHFGEEQTRGAENYNRELKQYVRELLDAPSVTS